MSTSPRANHPRVLSEECRKFIQAFRKLREGDLGVKFADDEVEVNTVQHLMVVFPRSGPEAEEVNFHVILAVLL